MRPRNLHVGLNFSVGWLLRGEVGARPLGNVSAKLSDGTTDTVDVTFSATGGTITNQGSYTAGSTVFEQGQPGDRYFVIEEGVAEVLGQVLRIGEYLTGAPSAPQEVFSWRRPRELDGVTFGPTPGPGDSDGG